MPTNEDTYVYDPLDRRTFEAIAYNAIGRGSETNTYPAYHLTHSSGLSGWSVGFMQWDFGQSGRGQKVPELLSGYQEWAAAEARFTRAEVQSLTRRLQTGGQHGNALSELEQTRLNSYLRSDAGRAFVDGLDQQQIAYKWDHVGQPLADIGWLQQLREDDAPQAAEMVAMTGKRFNQGEARGRQMIRHLQDGQTTSADLAEWVGTVGARAPANAAAITSGRDAALAAIALVNHLETGTGRISEAWRTQIHANGNVGLSQNFNSDANVQLLDAMLRNPAAGESILRAVEHGERPGRIVISGINAAANLEMARVELSRDGELSVQAPDGTRRVLTPTGWEERALPPPAHRAPAGHRAPRPPGEPPHGRPHTDAHPRARLSEADRAMLDQITAGVAELDRRTGKQFDHRSESLSYALLDLAKSNGFTAVDHVAVSTATGNARAGENIFVVQGGMNDPTNRVALMPTSVALATVPAEAVDRVHAMGAVISHSVAVEEHTMARVMSRSV